MSEPRDESTLTDDEMETSNVDPTSSASVDDSDDAADTTDDAADTGDDSGDPSDAADTGDDSGDANA